MNTTTVFIKIFTKLELIINLGTILISNVSKCLVYILKWNDNVTNNQFNWTHMYERTCVNVQNNDGSLKCHFHSKVIEFDMWYNKVMFRLFYELISKTFCVQFLKNFTLNYVSHVLIIYSVSVSVLHKCLFFFIHSRTFRYWSFSFIIISPS